MEQGQVPSIILLQTINMQGAKSQGAFSVQTGLGTTMTSQDILDGILRTTLMVAVAHPAEFIVISIEQKLNIF